MIICCLLKPFNLISIRPTADAELIYDVGLVYVCSELLV